MTPCVEWQGARNTQGYGKRGTKYIHRRTWEEHHGPIPDGLHIMHLCDNPPCYNIEHLHLGTRSENMKMAYDHGRHRPVGVAVNPLTGPRHPQFKLTIDQRAAIRGSIEPQRVVAARYGVSGSTVWRIRHEQDQLETEL